MDPGGEGGMGPFVCDGPTCGHLLCDIGDKLPADCSPCAAAICQMDSYCCEQSFDGQCQATAAMLCGCSCGMMPPPRGGQAVCTIPLPAPSGGACIKVDGSMADIACNPVTSAECTNPGESCDLTDKGYICYGGDNTAKVCEPCGQNNKYCSPGFTCIQGQCAAYCCDDGDCGGGICDKTMTLAGAGVCLSSGVGGQGGAGGAGGPGGGGAAGQGGEFGTIGGKKGGI
jgi:hypothetical protein